MASKMREALVAVKKLFDGRIMFQPAIRDCHEKVNDALATPRLNCEVGTVEEQAQRFNDYCHKQGNSCCVGRSKGACPMFRGYKVDCAIVWSQTPYEESEAKKCN